MEIVKALNPNAKTNNANTHKTHCMRGHAFTTENTYIRPGTFKRACRICTTTRNKERWQADLDGNREWAREHMRNWRQQNKERYNKKWKEDRRIKKQWLDEQKLTGCSKCPEKDPCCIDFHHVDPTQKLGNLAVKVAHWSIAKLQEEIAKCILLCSNCHRKLHAAERASSSKDSSSNGCN